MNKRKEKRRVLQQGTRELTYIYHNNLKYISIIPGPTKKNLSTVISLGITNKSPNYNRKNYIFSSFYKKIF